LKATTIDNYAKLLRLTVDDTPLSRLELATVARADVAEWRWVMPEERATLTWQAYSLLHSVFAEAVRAGLLETNPATLKGAGKPQRRREPQALTADQARAYLDAAPVKWRAALLIMVTAGLRIGEVLALHVDDLDLDRGTLTVRATVAKVSTADPRRRERVLQAPKTAAARRTVHLLPNSLPELSRLLQGRPERPVALLFPDTFGGLLDDDVLRRAHHKAVRAVGLDGIRPHDLRATALTMSAQAGATVKELQAQADHTTAATALQYQTASAQRDQERARRVAEAWK